MMRTRDISRRWGVLVGALAFGLASAPAFAQDEDAPASESKSEDSAEDDGSAAADMAAGVVVTKDKDGLAPHLNANFTTFVGQGVFASGAGRNGTVLSQLSVSPSLSVGGVLLFVSQAMQWEYTEPNAASGRRVALFDTTIGVQHALRFEGIDTRLLLTGGLRLPVSWQSRAQGSIGGVFAGATAVWRTPLSGLQVVLGVRGQANSSIDSLRATGDENAPGFDQEAANCLTRSGERAIHACAAVPNVANLSGQLQLAYTIGKVTTSVGFSVLSFVRAYAGPDDEFRSDNARAGVNATTFSSGTIQVTYPATSFLILSGGVSSFQPIQTADGQGMRFPFWNFNGVANAYSSVFVGGTVLF